MMNIFNRLNIKNIKNDFTKLSSYYKQNGLKRTGIAVAERLTTEMHRDYCYTPPSMIEMTAQKEFEFDYAPKISIVVPVYNPNRFHFISLLDSFCAQTYSKFEVIFADASQSNIYEKLIFAHKDSRFVYVKLEKNLGISGNANAGLERATGEYAAIVDHDDEITPDCLFECVEALNIAKNTDGLPTMLYTDEDKYDGAKFFKPHYKPSFNYDWFLTNNYICHFTLIHQKIFADTGFRSRFDGAQDYDLFLRIVGKLLDDGVSESELDRFIIHLPRVLYHWRAHETSTSMSFGNKSYAHEAGKAAVSDFLKTRRVEARVLDNANSGYYYIYYKEPFFENRRDVGVVGGNMLLNGRIFSGEITPNGVVKYFGTPIVFGGYFNRIKLQKDVFALDLRNMRVCPELKAMHKEFLLRLNEKTERLELLRASAPKRSARAKMYSKRILKRSLGLSLAFCDRVRQAGYLILYDPKATVKINANYAK